MKSSSLVAFFVSIFLISAAVSQETPITIRAGTLLDGRGKVLHDVSVVVQNGKVVRVEKSHGTPAYDLHKLTVLPGWIDVHVHITWYFGADGRLAERDNSPAQGALAAAGNAWTTLMAGFTTVQSVGSPEDKDLRTAINAGEIPGPRILTALRPIADPKLTPEQIR